VIERLAELGYAPRIPFEQGLADTVAWYRNNPAWGGLKTGAGYIVYLRNPAPVTKIQLNTNSTGGRWEIRATSADDPQGGTLLGTGAFSEFTELDRVHRICSTVAPESRERRSCSHPQNTRSLVTFSVTNRSMGPPRPPGRRSV
jgi:hypothetical protein